jgi:glycosyltransferase involved in cell wall biosynthesis
MKILYIIHSLPIGGAEMIAVSYLEKLKERGQDVCLLEVAHVDSFLYHRLIEKQIPVVTLRNDSLVEIVAYNYYPSLFLHRFNKKLQTIKPDVIHFQTVCPFMDRINFPISRCVYTFHARLDRSLSMGVTRRPLFNSAIDKGMSFVAISSKINQDIKKEFPLSKSYLIPNGVNLSQIRSQAKDKNEIRKELGIPVDAFVVGQVGRFNKVKNHLFTIDVFNVIAQKNDKAILALVGTGTKEETERLNERIAKYGLQDKVKLLGLRDDATQIMCGFDALIHPSFSESFSLVLIEAQANGIRCVASDAVPEEIACNDNCFRLSLDDSPELWAEKILGNDTTVNSSSLEKFDINTVTEQNIALYKSLLKD